MAAKQAATKKGSKAADGSNGHRAPILPVCVPALGLSALRLSAFNLSAFYLSTFSLSTFSLSAFSLSAYLPFSLPAFPPHV
jgi:hypothetical protein